MVERKEPIWLREPEALAIHDRQLSEHGGSPGIRDVGMLESALARPITQWSYGEDDLASLAAAYAFGIARDHPFADGNKRTAWVIARLFLAINRRELQFKPAEAISAVLDLAAGDLNEAGMADWFRRRLSD
jgi:death-on-curing protein